MIKGEHESQIATEDKVNIGFFTDAYAPQLNGIATSLEMLADALAAQGHRVAIFAPAMGDYLDARPHVHRVLSYQAVKDPPLWMATPFSASVLLDSKRLGLNIVHTHFPFSLHALAYQTARIRNLPLVYTYHTLLPEFTHTVKILDRFTMPQQFARFYSRWTCDLCDHIVAPTEKIKTALESYGVLRPISVISNGIQAERFQKQPRGFLRTRFNLRAADKIVLSVGRLTPEKNVEFLLRVLAVANSLDKDVYLALVGEGFLRGKFKEQAAALGLRDRLVFCGAFPYAEMPKVYADADVYVSASFSEAHSIATLEALASGLPLVVVNDPSLTTGVVDGKNGFVVPAEANVFAARVLEILRNSQLHTAMSLYSHHLASGFSVQAQVGKLVNLYDQLIAQKKSRRFWQAMQRLASRD